ncbi:MAG: hypothetical protein HY719_14680 [Planctomycetes bacterium]|nr:hypothetical protein [Planctomycetota bacterium]
MCGLAWLHRAGRRARRAPAVVLLAVTAGMAMAMALAWPAASRALAEENGTPSAGAPPAAPASAAEKTPIAAPMPSPTSAPPADPSSAPSPSTPGEQPAAAAAPAPPPPAREPLILLRRYAPAGGEAEAGYFPSPVDLTGLPFGVVTAEEFGLGAAEVEALFADPAKGLAAVRGKAAAGGVVCLFEVAKTNVTRTELLKRTYVRSTLTARLRAVRIGDGAALASRELGPVENAEDKQLRDLVARVRADLAPTPGGVAPTVSASAARVRLAWKAPSGRIDKALSRRLEEAFKDQAALAGAIRLRGWTFTLLEFAGDGVNAEEAARRARSGLSRMPWLTVSEDRDRTLTLAYAPEKDPEYPVLSDVTPPVVAITSPLEGAVLNAAEITLAGTVDDATVEAVRLGERTAAVKEGRFEIAAFLSEGENRITVEARDRAGNVGAATVRLMRDTTPPTLAVDSVKDGDIVTAGTVTVAGPVAGARADGVTVTGPSGPVAVTLADGRFAASAPLSEKGHGINRLVVTAVDEAGNVARAELVVTYDSDDPIVSISPDLNGLVVAEADLRFVFYVKDDGAPQSLRLVTVNGAPAPANGSSLVRTASVRLARGENVIKAEAVDRAGRAGADSVTVVLDDEAPVIDDLKPEGPVLRAAKVAFSWRVTEPRLKRVELCIDQVAEEIPLTPDGKYEVTRTLADFGNRQLGMVRVSVTAVDKAGNTRTVSTLYMIETE